MEFLSKLWELYGHIYSLIAVVYMTLHILLPNQMFHPLRVTISCKENGCRWEAKARDFGGPFTKRLFYRLKAKHKSHFLKEHPDVEWIYG